MCNVIWSVGQSEKGLLQCFLQCATPQTIDLCTCAPGTRLYTFVHIFAGHFPPNNIRPGTVQDSGSPFLPRAEFS